MQKTHPEQPQAQSAQLLPGSHQGVLAPQVEQDLMRLDIKYKALPCDPDLADTSAFCAHYGYELQQSANALLITSSKGEPKYALCVVLAHSRLNNSKAIRNKLGARRLSFANAALAAELTGMQLGGVTPVGIPESMPVWIDERVIQCDHIILGGGNRSSKIMMPPAELLKIPNSELVEDLAVIKTPACA